MRDAHDRAEALLLEHLDDEQAATWQDAGIFIVDAPSGNRYRVERDGSQVRNLGDRTVYCFQPIGTVPRADTALAHKLWLEADEAGFLKAANSFPYPNEWDREYQHQNCQCRLDPNRGLYLRTLDEARAFMEGQNWDVFVTITQPEIPFYYGLGRERVGFLPRQETTYEVNDMPSDAHTVDLLQQVAIERNERHAAAFSAGVETERNRMTFTQQELDYLSNLDCPMEVQVREGYCDAQP